MIDVSICKQLYLFPNTNLCIACIASTITQEVGVVSHPLHTHGNAHPPTDAEGCHAPPATRALEGVQEGDEDAAARGSDRVAQSDGTSSHVHLQVCAYVLAKKDLFKRTPIFVLLYIEPAVVVSLPYSPRPSV